MQRERVLVHCPACDRRHTFAASVYPCSCGAPIAPPLLRGAAAERVTHRTWAEGWVAVRCEACGTKSHWPQPEFGCPCGSVLRVPVQAAGPDGPLADFVEAAGDFGGAAEDGIRTGDRLGRPPLTKQLRAAAPRPAFRPLTIRTAGDAVTAAALYLRWLGFQSVVLAEEHLSAVDLRGPDVVAQVDPTTSPVSARAVECLWLHGLNDAAECVFFSLAGYTQRAHAQADTLSVPLFVMDLTGAPEPVNSAADTIVSAGA